MEPDQFGVPQNSEMMGHRRAGQMGPLRQLSHPQADLLALQQGQKYLLPVLVSQRRKQRLQLAEFLRQRRPHLHAFPVRFHGISPLVQKFKPV